MLLYFCPTVFYLNPFFYSITNLNNITSPHNFYKLLHIWYVCVYVKLHSIRSCRFVLNAHLQGSVGYIHTCNVRTRILHQEDEIRNLFCFYWSFNLYLMQCKIVKLYPNFKQSIILISLVVWCSDGIVFSYWEYIHTLYMDRREFRRIYGNIFFICMGRLFLIVCA